MVVKITHQEVGEMVGTLRESVTRILAEFQRQGLVTLSRGHILVCDRGGLKLRAQEG